LDSLINMFQRHNRTLATTVSVVIVILMSLSVANTVLFFLESTSGQGAINLGSSETDKRNNNRSQRTDSGVDSGNNIASLNLFGEQAVQAATVAVDAPETKLNLELQGVFNADVPEDSTAIVAELNKNGELYRIGDRLPGNAILDSVFSDHILIRRGAKLEKLLFSDSKIRQQFTRTSANSATAQNQPLAQNSPTTRLQQVRERIAERKQSALSNPQNQPQNQPRSKIREYVSALQKRISDDPAGLLTELGVSAVESGSNKGYRIGSEASQQALAQAGLQSGDVVLSVNGQPVGNVINDQNLINQAMNSARVRVEVQRNERRFFVTVPTQ
jgi:general secretion pathway protein C